MVLFMVSARVLSKILPLQDWADGVDSVIVVLCVIVLWSSPV